MSAVPRQMLSLLIKTVGQGSARPALTLPCPNPALPLSHPYLLQAGGCSSVFMACGSKLLQTHPNGGSRFPSSNPVVYVTTSMNSCMQTEVTYQQYHGCRTYAGASTLVWCR